jgi:hypothetical protein
MSDAVLTDEELLAALESPPASPIASPQVDPAPAGPNITRINFGGLKEKPKAEAGNTQYPVLPDPTGETSALADDFLKWHAAEAQAKGAKEVARGQLVERASPFHWQTNCGRGEVSGTVSVRGKTGAEVLVQFKDAYKNIADVKDKAGNIVITAEERIKAMPPEVFAKFFRQTFTIEIDSVKIPDGKLQTVVDKMQSLAAELGIEDAVAISAAFKPLESWHHERYRVLTPEQNMAIEKGMGEKGLMTIAVTAARGRKK